MSTTEATKRAMDSIAAIYREHERRLPIMDAERAVIAAAESRRSACREAWDPLDRAVDDLRAARSAAKPPVDEEDSEEEIDSPAMVAKSKARYATRTPAARSTTKPLDPALGHDITPGQACGIYVNDPPPATPRGEMLMRFTVNVIGALVPSEVGRWMDADAVEKHVTALESALAEARKRVAEVEKDAARTLNHAIETGQDHAAAAEDAERQRDAALAERDQHAADACALRMRVERLVQAAQPPTAEADESRIGMRSCLKACGKYFAVSGDKEMVLMIAQALEADKAAPPPAADAAPIEACLSKIMDEPNNCADRDHVRNILRKHFPAADAGTGTISDEELAVDLEALWCKVPCGDDGLNDWREVARRAKELLGGRTPEKLPEMRPYDSSNPFSAAKNQAIGWNLCLESVRAALAGRGET